MSTINASQNLDQSGFPFVRKLAEARAYVEVLELLSLPPLAVRVSREGEIRIDVAVPTLQAIAHLREHRLDVTVADWPDLGLRVHEAACELFRFVAAEPLPAA